MLTELVLDRKVQSREKGRRERRTESEFDAELQVWQRIEKRNWFGQLSELVVH
jgi:hypothetical protein